MLHAHLVYVFLLFGTCFTACNGEGGEGNPHFQIDHKSGKLDIMATRSSADIESTEDYVDLVMKPGETVSSLAHHDVHHDDVHEHDEESKQRHEMPKEEESRSGWKETEESGLEGRNSQVEGKLNNFDGKWQNLFKFPKANATVNSSTLYNATSKSDGGDNLEEKEKKKMVELQNDASNLAQLIEESSNKAISPSKITDAAANLESKVEELQRDVLRNFVNGTNEEGLNFASGNETVKEEDQETKGKQISSEKTSKATKVESKDKDDKNCKNCGTKVPKPGDKSDDGTLIVPKLSGANDTENQNSFSDDEKGEEGDRKIKANMKDNKNCKNCGTKVPKPGDKSDDGKLIVPKLSGANDTENQNSFAEGGKSEEGNGKESKMSDKKLESKGNDKSKDFKSGSKATKGKENKDCENCQGNIPKPGDKDDGKLIVPKLTNENETKNAFNQMQVGEEIQTARVDKTESFDLDDDAQEITEDANYLDLSNSATDNVSNESANVRANDESKKSANYLGVTNSTTENIDDEDGKVHVNDELQNSTNYADLKNSTIKNIEDKDGKVDVNDKPSNSTENHGLLSNEKSLSNKSGQDRTVKQDEDVKIEKEHQEVTKENEGDGIKEHESETDGSNGQLPDGEGMLKGDYQTEKKSGDAGLIQQATETKDKHELEERQGNNTDDTGIKEESEGVNAGGINSGSSQVVSAESERRNRKDEKTPKSSNQTEATEKVETIKQFDHLLQNFLNHSSPQKRKELLKLTWHDLRQKYSKSEENAQNGKSKDSTSSEENRINAESNSNGSMSDALGTTSKQKVAKKQEKNEEFVQTVGRIKEKITLLKDLVAYTKMKKRQKKVKRPDPYAAFKRDRNLH